MSGRSGTAPGASSISVHFPVTQLLPERANFPRVTTTPFEKGFSVFDDDDDDPVLIDSTGAPVDTWRENYPYDERMSRPEYEEQKRLLQIELLKLQKWTQANGLRHVLVFEGRDAAGKGGTIKRFMEHLNPRGARVVAL